MTNAITDRRIAGTRITVWDVLHYLERGRSHQEIAGILNLSEDQVRAAVEYIDEHRDEVLEVHRRIEERNARGNPPDIDEKLRESREKREAWQKQRERQPEGSHARNSAGR
jgi:uncharacterized protein (DUF433 family)